MENPNDYQFAGSIMPFQQFKKILGIDQIQFMQGKAGKRQFASTAVGTLFMSAKYKKDEPAFVYVAPAGWISENGNDLGGTFWLCNSTLTEGDLL